ncbi:hypothetical protein KUCAC02_023515 [Chaenocephalus aceratus]|uniref:Uncharacterized protein n=1 Tax=Chaenocephalus aceratus TaxID=36190 RepID=A0ACB9XS27_CHAAC|nr:hypothetical protein KUCAC02_023515 [Chaenocephalus aceratus]
MDEGPSWAREEDDRDGGGALDKKDGERWRAQVEEELHNPTQLVRTGFEEQGADAIWTRCLPRLTLLQLPPHLV